MQLKNSASGPAVQTVLKLDLKRYFLLPCNVQGQAEFESYLPKGKAEFKYFSSPEKIEKIEGRR